MATTIMATTMMTDHHNIESTTATITPASVPTTSSNLLPPIMVLHMLSGFEIKIPLEENENGIDIYHLRNRVRDFLIKNNKLQYPYDDTISFIRSEEDAVKLFVSLEESPITIVISKNVDHDLNPYYYHQPCQ